jgi:hypothetical protein
MNILVTANSLVFLGLEIYGRDLDIFIIFIKF